MALIIGAIVVVVCTFGSYAALGGNSTDRVNSSRRTRVRAGLPSERIDSVAGRADREPLKPDRPFDPQNRRISVILLRENPRSARRASADGGAG